MEIRPMDLRFTHSDMAVFLNQVMDLNLLSKDIVILETRTEGIIAGLQLAIVYNVQNKFIIDYAKHENVIVFVYNTKCTWNIL